MPSYESPTPDAHEYGFQLNVPSPKEVSTNFEVSRAAVQEVADYVNEIENAKLITGVRMVIFGSSVAEPARPPSDIDVFLIYDSLVIPRYGKTNSKIENRSLSTNAEKIYGKLCNTEWRISRLDIGKPENEKETTLPHYIELVPYASKEFLAMLNQDPQINRRELLSAIFSTARLKCIPDQTQSEMAALSYLMPYLARSWEEIQSVQSQNDKQIQSFLKEAPLLIETMKGFHFEWIGNELAGLTALPPQEILERGKILLNKVVQKIDATLQDEQNRQTDEIAKKELYQASKRLRTSFQCYIEGRNYVQTAIGNGAVLIKGENVLDQNEQPVFTMVDKEFLK